MLAAIAAKAKGLGVLTAAVVAGGLNAGVLTSAAASSPTPSPSSSHGSQHPAPHNDTDSNDAQGVHGQCVSKVARDHSAVGGPHHNHGGAVSAAAHSCPHS